MGNATSNISIKYITQQKIDREKWDRCLTNSPEGTIYCQSFYLDALSKNWDALIFNDYEAVMPLTWNKKFGFKYLYQPNFLRHTGIFGRSVTPAMANDFIAAIPTHFKFCEIDLKENIIEPPIDLPHLQLKKRRNFFLHLNKSYEEIKNNYKRLARRMLKKADENKIEIITNNSPEEVINFYKNNYRNKQKHISNSDYKRLMEAANIAFKNGKATTYLAKLNEDIVGAYLLLQDEKFVYSLIGGTNKAGKETGAFYKLTDAAIKDNAQTERIFRFEGSDREGIALFNQQFNPQEIHYYQLRFNKLPLIFRWLKNN